MTSHAVQPPAAASEPPGRAALQRGPWRRLGSLSSALGGALDAPERFLAHAGFDRTPWLAVSLAGGIGLWFALANLWQWLALIALCFGAALAGLGLLRAEGRYPWLRMALVSVPLALAAGCAIVWSKSWVVGEAPIKRPTFAQIEGTVISRQEQPAEARVRLVLATREPQTGRAIKVRVNLPLENDNPAIAEGARLRLQARLMPPSPPMLPGGYDFARTAWFQGISATGSVVGEVALIRPGGSGGWLSAQRTALSRHVREQLPGPAGAMASAFASGDRGSIGAVDDEAMRDAGLAHLLSISGLHVSALVAAVYFVAMRLFGLWPWLALRARLPLLAAGAGALAGIGYTLLTGAEVPTVRSCVGAVLVLVALALGREPLSLRMLAVAACFVMLLWPEAVVSPGFQMSFASVIAIIALHGAAPVRHFLLPREEAWWQRLARNLAMLLLTGVVIELALLPIGLFHFHRAGVYGALANVIAIPLTTFVSMPLIALALLLDTVGAGAPAWWLAGKSLELLLGMAHWIAAQPGAVTMLPAMGRTSIALFAAGGLWLALWRGRVRLWGLVPVLGGALALAGLRSPDILISADGRNVGITGESSGGLLVLRDSKSSFVRDNLTETAGMNGEVRPLADWPAARCTDDFCSIVLERHGRAWHLLLSRSRERVPERELAAACERSDIVVSERWLPASCRPAVLKADRRLLEQTGGLTIDLGSGRLHTVAESQGDHGWWQKPEPRKRPSAGSGGSRDPVQPAQPKAQ